MNEKIERRSPVCFDIAPERVERRANWPVALTYPNEGPGPHVVDLSHCAKWDFQSAELDRLAPWDLTMPGRPGSCTFDRGILLNRLNATQAVAWHVDGPAPPMLHIDDATDITDAAVLLGLVGPHLFRIMEKLTALDFFLPGRDAPFVVQGPVCHVPCRLVAFSSRPTPADALLISGPRGYAHDMTRAVLRAGREFGLRPAGELAWSRWVGVFLKRKEV